MKTEAGWEVLQRRCPELYTDGPDTKICCTDRQITTMDVSIRMAEGIYGRCKTCLKNLVRSICALSCDTRQSEYIETEVKTNIVGIEYVSQIWFNITEKYMDETYKSCSEVIHPQSGRLGMDIGCGSFDSNKCTADRWFRYMGDTSVNPDFVPFTINYLLNEDPEHTWVYDPLTCDVAYEGNFACSCLDCKASCPEGAEPQPDDLGFTVGPLNGYTFTISIIITVFGLIGVSLLFKFRNGTKSIPEFPKFIGGFEDINIYISKFFCWWGTKCAKNPVLVLAICSWVIGILCYGIFGMIIVTDPVELWASPNSRSRVEKDYYDSRFGPFYRTNQVFIKPINQDYVSIFSDLQAQDAFLTPSLSTFRYTTKQYSEPKNLDQFSIKSFFWKFLNSNNNLKMSDKMNQLD